jgi:hypothetical protein
LFWRHPKHLQDGRSIGIKVFIKPAYRNNETANCFWDKAGSHKNGAPCQRIEEIVQSFDKSLRYGTAQTDA